VRLYQLASDVSGVCSLVRPMLKGCRAMAKGVLSVEHTPGASFPIIEVGIREHRRFFRPILVKQEVEFNLRT